MKSYQVDLFCDGPGCKAVCAGQPQVDPGLADEAVIEFAVNHQWKNIIVPGEKDIRGKLMQMWLCPECYAKGTARLSHDLTTKTP